MINQETVVEINLSNLKKNLDFLKSKIRKETLVMAVVKAFAYGSDSTIISKKLGCFVYYKSHKIRNDKFNKRLHVKFERFTSF